MEETSTNTESNPKEILPYGDICYKNYNETCDEIKPFLTSSIFNILGLFMGEKMDNVILHAAKEIEENSLYSLVNSPSKFMESFVEFLESKIQTNVSLSISLFWPPVSPSSSPFFRSIIAVLVEIIKTTKQPERALSWILCSFGRNGWFKGDIKKEILAYSVVYSSHKKNKIAILDGEKVLYIYGSEISNSSALKCLFKKETVRAKREKGSDYLLFTGPTGEIIARLRFKNPENNDLWISAYSKNPHNIINFFGELQNPVPSLIYQGVYATIVQPDMLLVRTLLQPNIIPYSSQIAVLSSLIDVANYSQRTVFFLKTLFAIVCEQPDATIDNLTSRGTILYDFAPLLASKMAQEYIHSFCAKLSTYIESNSTINPFTNSTRFGIVFFTTLKYILDSYDLIPDTLKQTCSIFASYVTIKFNNLDYTIRAALSPITFIICSYLDKKYQDTNIQAFDFISTMVSTAFNFKKLDPKYNVKKWSERLEKHFRPKAMEVAKNLINFKKSIKWPIPNVDNLVKSIEHIIKILTKNYKEISKGFEDLQKGNTYSTNGYEWSFATYLSMFFKDNNDNSIIPPEISPLLSMTQFAKPEEKEEEIHSSDDDNNKEEAAEVSINDKEEQIVKEEDKKAPVKTNVDNSSDDSSDEYDDSTGIPLPFDEISDDDLHKKGNSEDASTNEDEFETEIDHPNAINEDDELNIENILSDDKPDNIESYVIEKDEPKLCIEEEEKEEKSISSDMPSISSDEETTSLLYSSN